MLSRLRSFNGDYGAIYGNKRLLNINFGNTVITANIMITNVLVRSVSFKIYNSVDDLNLDFARQTNGVYYISIAYADNRMERFKFIKGN